MLASCPRPHLASVCQGTIPGGIAPGIREKSLCPPVCGDGGGGTPVLWVEGMERHLGCMEGVHQGPGK